MTRLSTITLGLALLLNACSGGDTVTNFVPAEGTGGSSGVAGSTQAIEGVGGSGTGGSSAAGTGGQNATGGQYNDPTCPNGYNGCPCVDVSETGGLPCNSYGNIPQYCCMGKGATISEQYTNGHCLTGNVACN